jgi:Na+/H+-dicarboxylate symporter
VGFEDDGSDLSISHHLRHSRPLQGTAAAVCIKVPPIQSLFLLVPPNIIESLVKTQQRVMHFLHVIFIALVTAVAASPMRVKERGTPFSRDLKLRSSSSICFYD